MSLEIWYFAGMALSMLTLWLTVLGTNKLTKQSPVRMWIAYLAVWTLLLFVWWTWAGAYPGPTA